MITSRERVAFFLPGLYEGGAERVVLNLAEGIAREATRSIWFWPVRKALSWHKFRIRFGW